MNDAKRAKNLSIESPSMGRLLIQPARFPTEDEVKSEELRPSMLIYPRRMSEGEIEAATEWAASTKLPIFCHAKDIPRLMDEGFGAYRFNKLDGYKEIYFRGGVIEFYPAHRQPRPGFKGLMQEAGEFFRVLPTQHYHVLLRPQRESPVLHLASSRIDTVEWQVLSRARPAFVIGSPEVSRQDWQVFSLRCGRQVGLEESTESVTIQGVTGAVASATREAWPTQSGSQS